MDRMIYTAMTGAKLSLERQDVVAHNLANVSTPGFRAVLTAARSEPVQGGQLATRVAALESTPGYSTESGDVQMTGRPLDVAMQGQAWLAVQAADGTEAYTRAGSLNVTSEGQLVTTSGQVVLGDGGPITMPSTGTVDIATDGTISAHTSDGKTQAVGRLKLVTPDAALTRGEDGLFRSSTGDDLSTDASARLQSGAVEGSNVHPVEAMVEMIAASRQFEQQMKMLQAAQEKEQQGTKLLSNQG